MPKRVVFRNKAELIEKRITAEDVVLDVGFSGQGVKVGSSKWPHALLQSRASEVYGVDLEIDRGIFPDTTRYTEASAEDFSFERRFSVVFAGDLIEHLSNHGQFLDSCRAHLERGGRLILTTPNTFNLFNLTEKLTKDEPTVNSDHTCYFNHTVLKKLLEKNNFAVEEVAYVYSLEYTHRESVKKKMLNIVYRVLSYFTPKFTETLVIIAKPV